MIYLDLPGDLNLEDDEGRNIARRRCGHPGRRHPGYGAGGCKTFDQMASDLKAWQR